MASKACGVTNHVDVSKTRCTLFHVRKSQKLSKTLHTYLIDNGVLSSGSSFICLNCLQHWKNVFSVQTSPENAQTDIIAKVSSLIEESIRKPSVESINKLSYCIATLLKRKELRTDHGDIKLCGICFNECEFYRSLVMTEYNVLDLLTIVSGCDFGTAAHPVVCNSCFPKLIFWAKLEWTCEVLRKERNTVIYQFTNQRQGSAYISNSDIPFDGISYTDAPYDILKLTDLLLYKEQDSQIKYGGCVDVHGHGIYSTQTSMETEVKEEITTTEYDNLAVEYNTANADGMDDTSMDKNCETCGKMVDACGQRSEILTTLEDSDMTNAECQSLEVLPAHEMPLSVTELNSMNTFGMNETCSNSEGDSLATNDVTKSVSVISVEKRRRQIPNRKFICNFHLCCKKFRNRESLERHISKAHEISKLHSCPLCNRRYMKKDSWKCHMSKQHQWTTDEITVFCDNADTKPYVCSTCQRAFTVYSSLIGHRRRHHKVTTSTPNTMQAEHYSCEGSNMEGGEKNNLTDIREHCKLSNSDGKNTPKSSGGHACPICHIMCESDLVDHMKLHHPEYTLTTDLFSCKLCGAKYGKEVLLQKHLEKVHDENKPHKCPECTGCFSRHRDLLSHYALHTGFKPYACHLCEKSFLHKSELLKHKRIKHADHTVDCTRKEQNERHRCNRCGQDIQSVENLEGHKQYCPVFDCVNQEADGSKVTQLCPICGIFCEKQGVKKHMKINHPEHMFPCNLCGVTYKENGLLQKHMKKVHDETKRHCCDVCNKRFSSSYDLKTHMAIHAETHKCPTCGKCFSKHRSLEIHYSVHTGFKPYACDLCDMSFVCNSKLLQHKRLKHPKMLECNVEQSKSHTNACKGCGLSFTERSGLTEHEVTCMAEGGKMTHLCPICGKFCEKQGFKKHMISHAKSHKCPKCGRGFSTEGAVRRHLQSSFHVRDRLFPCDQCGKHFLNKYVLNRHIKTHDDLKPHNCTTCGKSFRYKCILDRHSVVHTGARPYTCSACGMSFTHKGAVVRHQKVSCQYDCVENPDD